MLSLFKLNQFLTPNFIINTRLLHIQQWKPAQRTWLYSLIPQIRISTSWTHQVSSVHLWLHSSLHIFYIWYVVVAIIRLFTFKFVFVFGDTVEESIKDSWYIFLKIILTSIDPTEFPRECLANNPAKES